MLLLSLKAMKGDFVFSDKIVSVRTSINKNVDDRRYLLPVSLLKREVFGLSSPNRKIQVWSDRYIYLSLLNFNKKNPFCQIFLRDEDIGNNCLYF